jgi:beta-glucosidase
MRALQELASRRLARVLTGKYDFTAKLSFSWPKDPDQTPLNVGDAT